MILAIDIGNTRSTFVLMRDNVVIREEHAPSGRLSFRRALELMRRLCDNNSAEPITAAGLASVVPHLTDLACNAATEVTGITPTVVTAATAGVPTSYPNPETIGADRLCNCVAAFKEAHGAAIVIDCGTAVTLDCVAGDGAFLGGAILPGYRTATRALNTITAQLPEIELVAPAAALGASTDECLRSGILLGTTYAIEGLIGRMIFERFGDDFPALIVTGGHADLFAGMTSLTVQTIPDLVLKGIARIVEG